MKPLILGGEVSEGSMQLLDSSHNVLGGDRGTRTKYLDVEYLGFESGPEVTHLQVLLCLFNLLPVALHLTLKLADQPGVYLGYKPILCL